MNRRSDKINLHNGNHGNKIILWYSDGDVLRKVLHVIDRTNFYCFHNNILTNITLSCATRLFRWKLSNHVTTSLLQWAIYTTSSRPRRVCVSLRPPRRAKNVPTPPRMSWPRRRRNVGCWNSTKPTPPNIRRPRVRAMTSAVTRNVTMTSWFKVDARERSAAA